MSIPIIFNCKFTHDCVCEKYKNGTTKWTREYFKSCIIFAWSETWHLVATWEERFEIWRPSNHPKWFWLTGNTLQEGKRFASFTPPPSNFYYQKLRRKNKLKEVESFIKQFHRNYFKLTSYSPTMKQIFTKVFQDYLFCFQSENGNKFKLNFSLLVNNNYCFWENSPQ